MYMERAEDPVELNTMGLHTPLDIMPIYHNVQNQRKLMKQTHGQKPHFGPDLGPPGPS